jgi:membrane protease YdiL (CAAX protease family)
LAGAIQAALIGMLVLIAGTIPRNVLFAVNLRYYNDLPWAVPVTASYLWLFWRYLAGSGPPECSRTFRRNSLRANRISTAAWTWSLLAGGLGIAALILALRVLNRLVVLPAQQLPGVDHIPEITIVSLLLMAAPVAGIVEEAAFRGYMQGPIERQFGLVVAILITGTMFAIAHLDFTPVLWPYYVAVAAIYGVVTHLTNSILPAIAIHTGGNIYSNFDLWTRGQAEWQASSGSRLIWETGVDSSFWMLIGAFLTVTAVMLWAYRRLSGATRNNRPKV